MLAACLREFAPLQERAAVVLVEVADLASDVHETIGPGPTDVAAIQERREPGASGAEPIGPDDVEAVLAELEVVDDLALEGMAVVRAEGAVKPGKDLVGGACATDPI